MIEDYSVCFVWQVRFVVSIEHNLKVEHVQFTFIVHNILFPMLEARNIITSVMSFHYTIA